MTFSVLFLPLDYWWWGRSPKGMAEAARLICSETEVGEITIGKAAPKMEEAAEGIAPKVETIH